MKTTREIKRSSGEKREVELIIKQIAKIGVTQLIFHIEKNSMLWCFKMNLQCNCCIVRFRIVHSQAQNTIYSAVPLLRGKFSHKHSQKTLGAR